MRNTSLLKNNPSIAKEWHPAKNIKKPSEVSYTSSEKVWWIGTCGHEWEAEVRARAERGTNCPFCSNVKILKGFNDLSTTHPEISKQWHPILNIILTADNAVAGSGKKAWWVCDKGHEWESSIRKRTIEGMGCPFCANKSVIIGFNDLATIKPALAAEWNKSKNVAQPTQYTTGSGFKAWWLGKCGHEWQASINDRNRGKGCPVCCGKVIVVGFNDLEAVNPSLASEWHPRKNKALTPAMFTSHSRGKIWWLGKCGHEWQATIINRSEGAGCHYCSNQKVLNGFNDLVTIKPDVAKKWHPTLNGKISPAQVGSNNIKKYWWLGTCGHEWHGSIASVARSNREGCPKCNYGGFNASKPSIFYFIKNEKLNAIKIGITNSESPRLRRFISNGWSIVHFVHSEEGTDIRDLESNIKIWIKKDLLLNSYLNKSDMNGMCGWTETFDMNKIRESDIIDKINTLTAKSHL